MAETLEARERKVIAETQKLRFFPLSVVGGEGSYLIAEVWLLLLELSVTF